VQVEYTCAVTEAVMSICSSRTSSCSCCHCSESRVTQNTYKKIVPSRTKWKRARVRAKTLRVGILHRCGTVKVNATPSLRVSAAAN
jgi:hypothetical protein